jgi:hypothetical protein
VASFEQELATARHWVQALDSGGRGERDLAVQLLAALWYLSLSDQFIDELLSHDHEFVFDGFITYLQQQTSVEDLMTIEILDQVRRLESSARRAVFALVQHGIGLVDSAAERLS